jgi:hypothetical protein
MKVNTTDFLEAFMRADDYIKDQCPGYYKVSNIDVRKDVPLPVYVKLISAFWEEFHGCKISAKGTNTYVHFSKPSELTAFLLRWA